MKNKVIGLVLAGILSVGMVGCGNNEVEYQEPQVQQEQTVDEDLTPQYKEKINKENELEMAKAIIEAVANEVGMKYDTRVEIITDEKSHSVIQVIDVDKQTVQYGISTGQWEELVEVWRSTSETGKLAFERAGLSTHYCIMFADLDSSSDILSCEGYLMIYDGTVTYNIAK